MTAGTKKTVSTELHYSPYVLLSAALLLPEVNAPIELQGLMFLVLLAASLFIPAHLYNSKKSTRSTKKFLMGGLLSLLASGFVIVACFLIVAFGALVLVSLLNIWFGESWQAAIQGFPWLLAIPAVLIAPLVLIAVFTPYLMMLVGASDFIRLQTSSDKDFRYGPMTTFEASKFAASKIVFDVISLTIISLVAAVFALGLGVFSTSGVSALNENGLIQFVNPVFLMWLPFYSMYLTCGRYFADYGPDIEWRQLPNEILS